MEVRVAWLAAAAELQRALVNIIFVAEVERDSVAQSLLKTQAAADCAERGQALVAAEIFERDLGAIERTSGMRRISLVEQVERCVEVRRGLRIIANVGRD